MMIRLKDENFRPPSPIRTIKRIPQLHLACDSTVESVGENGPIITAQEIKELMGKREELMSLIEELKSKKQEEKDKVTERFNLSKLRSLAIVQDTIRNSLTSQKKGGKSKSQRGRKRKK